MPEAERSVLHVLPHAGGGGDTYVDVLSGMPGYRFTRVYVAPSRSPGLRQVARGIVDVSRRVRAHDLLHVHGEAASGLFLPVLGARPSVVTLHGLHLLRRVTGLRRQGAALNLRAALRAADYTICVSTAERDDLTAAVGAAAAGRALVIHNGVRLPARAGAAERADVREQLGLIESEPVAIWVGSLDERRDPLSVVRAAERAAVMLLVVGDGPLRPDVERAAHARVRILGHRDDAPRLLEAADFFVLMSHREGLSFALLEAMAHGLPAVVADVAENIEAVGDSGIAVPYGDENALVAAFRRLVDNSAERAALAERARRQVAKLFDAGEMIGRTRAVYDEVLAGGPDVKRLKPGIPRGPWSCR
jgi:glycosyltransferase involved in cell wall biosynthesis